MFRSKSRSEIPMSRFDSVCMIKQGQPKLSIPQIIRSLDLNPQLDQPIPQNGLETSELDLHHRQPGCSHPSLPIVNPVTPKIINSKGLEDPTPHGISKQSGPLHLIPISHLNWISTHADGSEKQRNKILNSRRTQIFNRFGFRTSIRPQIIFDI